MLKNLVPANLYQFSRLFTERVYRHSHYLAPYSQRESDRSNRLTYLVIGLLIIQRCPRTV